MAVHGVILPLARYISTGEHDTDLMNLAALVTAVAGAFAVREWGKVKQLEHGADGDTTEGMDA